MGLSLSACADKDDGNDETSASSVRVKAKSWTRISPSTMTSLTSVPLPL